MSNNMIKLTESQLKKIVNESVKSVLNESFTDNRIAQAIKEHGGLSKFQNKFGAKINADYDLQTAAYKGYLSRETVNEIEAADLWYQLNRWLLYTNDGGAIVVDDIRNTQNVADRDYSWDKKVRQRNIQWGEDVPDTRYWEERHSTPNKFNTKRRREDRKNNK